MSIRNCPHCGLAFEPKTKQWPSKVDPRTMKHMKRCEISTPEHREFFKKYRRWPINVLSPEDKAKLAKI